MNKHKWIFSDLEKIPKNNLNVFSCFSCGGGSTMGYKLAGFNVIGNVEIDPFINEVYKANHNPKFNFNLDLRDFNKINNKDLPKELFDLFILDGSPPCSTFSKSGNRENDWGKEKVFKEGQKKQVLDDLFFVFIDTVEKLKPKIVIAENVKGLIEGKAKGYIKLINEKFEKIGYKTQLFLLNSSKFEVPQYRERVFFIAQKKEEFKKINISSNFKEISFLDCCFDLQKDEFITVLNSEKTKNLWFKIKEGENFSKLTNGKSFFNHVKIKSDKPTPTITATPTIWHYKYPRILNKSEIIRVSTFPDDFNFIRNTQSNYYFICGMSVPPFFIKNISKIILNHFK